MERVRLEREPRQLAIEQLLVALAGPRTIADGVADGRVVEHAARACLGVRARREGGQSSRARARAAFLSRNVAQT